MTSRRNRRRRGPDGAQTAASGAPVLTDVSGAAAPSLDWRPSADYSLTVALTDEARDLLDVEGRKIAAAPTADQVIESARRLGEQGADEGLPVGRTKEWIVRLARGAGLDRQTALKAALTGLSDARRVPPAEPTTPLRALPGGRSGDGETTPVGQDPRRLSDANLLLVRAAGLADEESEPPADPEAARHYRVDNPVTAMRWLIEEVGRNGLAGMLRRGHQVIYTARLGEDGYVEPPEKADDNGPATIRAVTPDVLMARLALNYMIHKMVAVKGKKGEPPRYYPQEIFFPRPALLGALASIDDLVNLRPLRGVTHTPMVRDDWSILDTPGYDEATGFLYLPTVEVAAVPLRPTRADVDAAVGLLRGMIDEFKWAGDHDEANFLGLLLTPLLRQPCPPPYKLGAIMARQPGSGKSLLDEIMRGVHGGVFRSEMPHDDAELAKSLASILTCTTAPVVQFDNVGGIVRSSRLAGLLTSAVYSDRILGSTNQVDMVNDRLWTLTGNNLAFGGDLVRRTLWVTIDPGEPNPHLRTDFRLHLPSYVAEHRGEIIRALLILIRSWVVAGARPAAVTSSDSYAGWTAAVRGILAHTITVLGEPTHREETNDQGRVRRQRTGGGIPGTFDHADSAQQEVGADDDGWRDFLVALADAEPFADGAWFTTRTVIDEMAATQPDPRGYPQPTPRARELLDALPPELHEKVLRAHDDPRVITKTLGRWFMNRNGRWVGDVTCERMGEDSKRQKPLYAIRRLTQGVAVQLTLDDGADEEGAPY